MTERGAFVAGAFRNACLAELEAIKPGNIFTGAEHRGMTVADFVVSAEAAAPVMGQPGLGVGERVLHAVEATRRAVPHNTNLGILLLAAPIASAALGSSASPSTSSWPGLTRASTATDQRQDKTVDGRVKPAHDDADDGSADPESRSLRGRLSTVLRSLTQADAVATYRAIRLAEPGGMGEVEKESVSGEPSATLLEAMRLAEDRDRIAWQYTHDFADLFEFGLSVLADARSRRGETPWAVTELYLAFLGAIPDSLIARKRSPEMAEEVQAVAAAWASALGQARDPEEVRADLLGFDRKLKQSGLNPGTTADLTVATLFTADLLAGRA